MTDLDRLLTLHQQSKNQKKKRPRLKHIEAGLWNLLKTGLKTTSRWIELTRLEAWNLPGIPDVLACNEDGCFSFLELKVRHGKKVKLSAHQVAWLSRHGHSNTFIVVRGPSLDINVYMGGCSVDLCMGDAAAVEALETFSEPYNWEAFWALTAPRLQV